MKLVGVLAWYDEDPNWLAASVASWCMVGIDHLVAVDGAYEMFPDGSARSGVEQHQALMEMVRPFGVGLTLHVPERMWKSEMEKRSLSFALAEQVSEDKDWYVVFDADEVAEKFELRRALEATDKLAAEAVSWERDDKDLSIRRFYRALRGLRVERSHFVYQAGDLTLRGYPDDDPVEAEKFPMRVEHRTLKDPKRRLRQEAFYRRRDEAGVEHHKCRECTRKAVITAPTNFKLTGQQLDAQWVEVCERHLAKVLRANQRKFERLNIVDPDSPYIGLSFDLERARQIASSTPDAARVA